MMLEFIPEKVDRAVVVNVMQMATSSQPPVSQAQSALLDSFVGSDFVVGIHNWLIGTSLKYIIFDLQDEKEVPTDFLEELMQLMRRLRVPFLFAGIMERPKAVLKSYAYLAKYPLFTNVEEAIAWLNEKHPHLIASIPEGINFGTPIEMVRSRLNGKPGEEGDDASSEIDD
jgi:hypothetical protein